MSEPVVTDAAVPVAESRPPVNTSQRALIGLGVLAAATVVAVLVGQRSPAPRAAAPGAQAMTAEAAPPSFLDRDPAPENNGRRDEEYFRSVPYLGAGGATAAESMPAEPAPSNEGSSAWRAAPEPAPEYYVPPPLPEAPPAPSAEEIARRSPLSISGGGLGSGRAGGTVGEGPDPLDARQATSAVIEALDAVANPPRPAAADPVRLLRTSSEAFATEEPSGTLAGGTLVPARLVTEIRSDLPGIVLAVVTRPVWDRRIQRILVPQGAQLVGEYAALQADRLQITWRRLCAARCYSIEVPTLSAEGESGLGGRVNRHLTRAVATTFVLSGLGTLAQLSQPRQVNAFGASPLTAEQTAVGAAAQSFNQLGAELLRRSLDLAPTIHVPAGTRFDAVIPGDLALR
ncbi:MAG TPA: TrbI/VirB10 family protein [Thermoanaerobaculia bacterium]|jgi:type IV secretion system protein VirB10|nr:TrbI/VirB10 family protein [Thermoanaerobaculia bacterium]